MPGDEEFNMLRAYRPGDAPRQIAWKALAREQGLLTKEFSAMASSELWLDWEDARGADVEARLAVLCHWVLQAEDFGQSFGLRLPGIEINQVARNITVDGTAQTLSAREWAVLEKLVEHPGAVVSKAQLHDTLYEFGAEIESNTVEVYISRLRKKIGHDRVETVRGVGYTIR